MLPRAKKAANPRKLPSPPPPPAQPFNFPAPIRGWVLSENLATAQPGGAQMLDNWVCTTTGIRVRAGRARYASLGAPVTALFAYRSGDEAIFAATESAIFDLTLVTDPNASLTAAVSGLTSGDWSAAQFGTAGGNFLYAVNGADDAQLFDGSDWTAIDGASTPAITGVTTSDLSHVWAYKNRLWFVVKDSLTAAYLPVDSIGGAAQTFGLAGVFTRGGTLLFGAKWSLDAGDGLDDKCVFVSSEGEVAIYEGSNPASATDWRLVGVYVMPRPLGKQAVVGAGGDLLIATVAGMIPISAAINTDQGAIETKAISANIAPHWRRLANEYPAGWCARKINNAGYMIVAAPDGQTCLIANLITGAWSRFTGWDVACVDEFSIGALIGGADGRVYRAESGGSDDGAMYAASYLGQHDAMGAFGATKSVRQMRATFRFQSALLAQVGATVDFATALPAPPGAVQSDVTNLWDTGLWDVAIWDAEAPTKTESIWSATGVTGTFIAPFVQMSFESGAAPQVELVSIDAMYHVGALVA